MSRVRAKIILKILYMDIVTVRESMNGNFANKKFNPLEDPITWQDVENVVKNSLGSTTKIINYHVRAFSVEKLGFLGAHRHLVVSVQQPRKVEKEIVTFFVKSIPYDNEEQSSVIEDSKAFFKETNFYERILPELMISVKDRSWIARYYLVKNDVMVFEDLKSRNFSLKDKFLDAIHVKSALTVLAKLHASSLLAEKRLGKGFLELYPNLFDECLFVRNGRFYNWYKTGVDVIVALAKRLNFNDDVNIRKICDLIFDKIVTSKTRRNVVSHGDAKSYNLMFDDSKPLPKCILIDFQLVRYAPPTIDILQLLYLSTRREFRDKNEEDLLRYYHEVLCKFLRDNNDTIEIPSFSELFQEYQEMRIVGIITAALYSPTNLMEGKLCAELTKDSDGFSKLLFGDRIDIILNIMKQNSMYKEVLNEIITEMMQRSKLAN